MFIALRGRALGDHAAAERLRHLGHGDVALVHRASGRHFAHEVVEIYGVGFGELDVAKVGPELLKQAVLLQRRRLTLPDPHLRKGDVLHALRRKTAQGAHDAVLVVILHPGLVIVAQLREGVGVLRVFLDGVVKQRLIAALEGHDGLLGEKRLLLRAVFHVGQRVALIHRAAHAAHLRVGREEQPHRLAVPVRAWRAVPVAVAEDSRRRGVGVGGRDVEVCDKRLFVEHERRAAALFLHEQVFVLR